MVLGIGPALDAARDGARIRRPEWGPGHWLILRGGTLFRHVNCCNNEMTYFDVEDFLALDWEIMPDITVLDDGTGVD